MSADMKPSQIHVLRTAAELAQGDFVDVDHDDRRWNGFPASLPNGPFVHLLLDAESPANTLTPTICSELVEVTERIAAMDDVEALFLWSAKEKHFIAGADIAEIESINFAETGTAKAEEGQEVIEGLARLPFPKFAVIRGTCLGGGLEMALGFDYRIAVDSAATRIGLPEIKLGIIPGFGGCQRLPRLIGLRAGLAHILAGSRLPARAAYRKGMVDAVVPAEGHRAGAVAVARKILADGGTRVRARRQKRTGGFVAAVLEKNPFGRAFLGAMAKRQVLAKTGGHYPAAPAAVRAIVEGFPKPLAEGLKLEAQLVGELIASDVSKSLIHVFQESERARRLELDDDGQGPEWPEVPFVGVLGSGIMGSGIATLLLSKGHEVRLRDLDPKALARGLKVVGRELEQSVRRRRITPLERAGMLSRLTHTTEATGFGRADMIIEAIVENLDVKRAAFAELEPQLPDDAILATNTSALRVTDIAEGSKRPERVVGLHFFNPVMRMPLVEVVPGAKTADWAVRRAVKLVQVMGKYPVVVKDSPGFLVNRLLMPYLDSACQLLEQGVTGTDIDAAAEKFGLPMGPFRLLDEVGIDIAAEVSATLHAAFGDRVRPSSLLGKFLERQWLGRKSGTGFYVHGGNGSRTWNAKLQEDLPSGRGAIDEDDIANHLVDPIVDEAARCLEEGVVDGPGSVDLAMVMGTGFPPFRGGPLRHADQAGLAAVVNRLRRRREEGEGAPPAKLLLTLASAGRGFYSLKPEELTPGVPAEEEETVR